MELQIGYNALNFRFKKSDDSELGDGPETEMSDSEPKKHDTSTMFLNDDDAGNQSSDLEYKPQFT